MESYGVCTTSKEKLKYTKNQCRTQPPRHHHNLTGEQDGRVKDDKVSNRRHCQKRLHHKGGTPRYNKNIKDGLC
jgi:hypothetical protein